MLATSAHRVLAGFVLAPGSKRWSVRGVDAGPKVATNGADRRIARCFYRPRAVTSRERSTWSLSVRSGHVSSRKPDARGCRNRTNRAVRERRPRAVAARAEETLADRRPCMTSERPELSLLRATRRSFVSIRRVVEVGLDGRRCASQPAGDLRDRGLSCVAVVASELPRLGDAPRHGSGRSSADDDAGPGTTWRETVTTTTDAHSRSRLKRRCRSIHTWRDKNIRPSSKGAVGVSSKVASQRCCK